MYYQGGPFLEGQKVGGKGLKGSLCRGGGGGATVGLLKRARLFGPISQPGGGADSTPKISETD